MLVDDEEVTAAGGQDEAEVELTFDGHAEEVLFGYCEGKFLFSQGGFVVGGVGLRAEGSGSGYGRWLG